MDSTENQETHSSKQMLDLEAHAKTMEAIRLLSGSLAHDFNNVLTSILGYSRMVIEDLESDTSDPEAMLADANQIQRAAGKGSQMCAQLAEFANMEKGFSVTCAFETFLDGAHVSVRDLIPEGVTLTWHLHGDPHKVRVDGMMILRLLRLLLENSVAAMPDGGEIQISTHPISDDDLAGRWGGAPPSVLLRVRDVGGGIDEEQLPHVFNPFYPFYRTQKLRGLGLSLVANIVHRHQGGMDLETGPEGTTFDIRIPLHQDEKDPGTSGESAPKHILVIDDDPNDLKLLSCILKPEGFAVKTASNGTDAATISHAHPSFDLVIVDHELISTTEDDFISSLKHQFPAMEVLFTEPFLEGEPGKTDFIQKPFRKRQLMEKISAALD